MRQLHLSRLIGGKPQFLNVPVPIPCPCCGLVMPFLALIEDGGTEETPNLSGGECGQITFYLCPGCTIIGVDIIGT
jgi:hypothetical protein